MKKPLTYSVGIHAVLVLLAIFGLPHILTPDDIEEPVPVEILTNAQIAELTSTNKPPVKAPPKEEPKKEQPPPPKKTEPPPPKPASTPPPPEEALKAPPKEEPKKEEPKKEEPKKEPPKKPPEKKPPPKKEEPKKDDTQSEMDKLLKDLQTPEDAPQPETTEPVKADAKPEPSSDVSRFSDVLSASEKDAMSSHYTPCWNVMAGGNSAESLAVEIRFTVTPANTLINPQIINQGRYSSDPTFRAAADSAVRATRNERCASLPAFMSKYSGQTIVINFDPRDMF